MTARHPNHLPGPASVGGAEVGQRQEISFRPLTVPDLALLVRWQSSPHVARWWLDPSDIESISAKYSPHIRGEERTQVFIVELDRRPIGLIQRYRHADYQDWDRAVGVPDAAGIDYYIGEPDLIGRGLGSTAIAIFALDTLRRYPEVDCVVAAPQQENIASWRALEKAGFTRIWEGQLDSDDPADEGPAFVYRLSRSTSGVG
ncbi:MAG: GNAT family N-acetyltransferase [Acidimicrobiales bacterium]